MSAAIDFAAIRVEANLRQVIESDLGPPVRGGRWRCPFHPDAENANLSLAPDGRSCRCWSCGWHGDALDYLAGREGITVLEAARHLCPDRFGTATADPKAKARSMGTPTPKAAPPPRPPGPAPAWQDPQWHAAVDAIISEAAAALWSPAGRPALAWLMARGLSERIIRHVRLGWNPTACSTGPIAVLGPDAAGKPRPLWVARGITIPWPHPEGWYSPHGDPPAARWVGCQVRCLDADFGSPARKYAALARSERGHAYPFHDFVSGLACLICEGEFDALLAHQEVGHAVNVLTVGGVEQTPQAAAMAVLDAGPAWLLAFDNDANRAGDRAARKFAGLAPHKCRRLWLPGANDLTDYHTGGGSLLDWLADEYARFGWAWPPVPIADDPSAWRAEVANWPTARWLDWRRRSAEALAGFAGPCVAADVRLADRLAFEAIAAPADDAPELLDRRPGPPPVNTMPGANPGGEADLVHIPAEQLAPGPTDWPPRPAELARWPVADREAWGRRTNELEAEGLGWRAAEQLAYAEVKEDRDRRGGGSSTPGAAPPPTREERPVLSFLRPAPVNAGY